MKHLRRVRIWILGVSGIQMVKICPVVGMVRYSKGILIQDGYVQYLVWCLIFKWSVYSPMCSMSSIQIFGSPLYMRQGLRVNPKILVIKVLLKFLTNRLVHDKWDGCWDMTQELTSGGGEGGGWRLWYVALSSIMRQYSLGIFIQAYQWIYKSIVTASYFCCTVVHWEEC